MPVNPEYIIVIDERGVEWSYRIADDPEMFEIVKSRGRLDEKGRLVLSLPYIAALKKWAPDLVLNRIDARMKEIGIPSLSIPEEQLKENLDVISFDKCTNSELEQYLAKFGAYSAYLEAQLSYYESKRYVLESSFEEGMSKALYQLSSEKEGRVLKDILHGEIISKNEMLRKIKQDLIELTGLCMRLTGLRDAYKAMYYSVSRIIALRTSGERQ